MPHDVVIVGASACVNKEQPATNRHPVLLCVVTSQRRAIIECPFPDFLELQAIVAAGHER